MQTGLKKVLNWNKHDIHQDQDNLKPHALLIFIRPRFDYHCRHSLCHPCCWDLNDEDVEDFNSVQAVGDDVDVDVDFYVDVGVDVEIDIGVFVRWAPLLCFFLNSIKL